MNAERDDAGAGNQNEQTIRLGEGDDSVTVDASGGGHDTFRFTVDGSNIGSNDISNFDSAERDDGGFGNVDDVLEFGQISGTPSNFSSISGTDNGDTGTITDGNGNEVLQLELVNGGDDTLIEAGDDASFNGSVTLVGVGDLGNIDGDNFDFTG
ncbi:MAG: hypothetical protein ACLFSI_08290 [Halorhodospira sp.]